MVMVVMMMMSFFLTLSILILQAASTRPGVDLPLERLLHHWQALQSGRECLRGCAGRHYHHHQHHHHVQCMDHHHHHHYHVQWTTIIITIMIIEVSLDFNQEAEQTWKSESFSTENSSLLLLLRGVCLRYMGGALIF